MNWRKIGRWLLLVLGLALLILFGASWWMAGTLMAPANRPVEMPSNGLPLQSITIHSQSGSLLAAWFIPSEEATATVILLHPIRGDRRAMLSRAELLREAGYSTLLVDLQAHGESQGDAVTAGYFERHDVTATVDFVRTRHPDQQIAVIGRSLGGAATLLASPLEIDALVLESVYPTIAEAVHNRVSMRLGPLHHALAPVLMFQLNLRLGISASQLRPIDHIAEVGCPVLIASGDLDQHTTLVEAERLYRAAREPKQLVVFPGAAHVDLLAHDEETYRSEVLGFLNAHLLRE